MKKFIGKNKADALSEHLSKEAFDMLSDTEKADYYTSLAEERVNARTPEERKGIAEAYRSIGKYRNAARFASELENEAQKQIEELQREKAERKKNIIKYGCIALGAIVLAVAVSLAVSLADTKGRKYGEAVELYNEGKYSEALEIFNTIPSYKDTNLYIIAINGTMKDSVINGQRARVGDTVTFGEWYAGSGSAGERKEIKWIVLEVDTENRRAFVISADILYSAAYGNTDVWKNSDICSWLNGEFLTTAFSESEQKKLVKTLYEELDGNGDVLSAFSSKIALMSQAEKTKYLTDLRIIPAEGAGESQWWLRTASGEGKIMYIAENGQLATVGTDSKETMGVRPVAWIALD